MESSNSNNNNINRVSSTDEITFLVRGESIKACKPH